jgi:flagellar protein FliS
MSYARHLQTYRHNQASTLDSGTLLLLLYQGAIDFLRQAQAGLERNNMEEKGYYVLKVIAIISELQVSLNCEVGGEVAKNLHELYRYMMDQITLGNVHNEAKYFTVVIELLETLKDGWTDAVMEVRKQGMVVAQRKPEVTTTHEHSFAARA